MIDHVGDLLAIDPSLRSSGAALFRAGVLIAADRIKVDMSTAPPGARVLRMAHEIASWVVALKAEPRVLVYEWPQVYRAARSPGDPNDLIGLSAVGACVAGIVAMGMARLDIGLQVLSPTPAEWAGQLPKTKTVAGAKASPRAIRIGSRLSTEEAFVIPASHDAIDAVGIGLWALGRLEPVRVFSR